MPSDLRTTIGVVKTTLAGIAGGSYVHDFSATGRVRIGQPTAGDGPVPCVWVFNALLRNVYSAELGSWRRELLLDLEARVPASSSDSEERLLIGVDCLDDIFTALHANRTLTGSVLDSHPVGCAFDGDELGLTGCAVVRAQLLAWWESTALQGV